MASAEAVSLLRYGLSEGPESEFGFLAARLEGWPLLLKLVNRQLWELMNEDGMAVGEALTETEKLLKAEGFSAFDRDNQEDRNAAAGRTISVSIRRLSEGEQERYISLAVFPEDADVPLSLLAYFWYLPQREIQNFCKRLHDLSLLLRFNRKAGTIRLHDVIRQVLIGRSRKKLPFIHQRLLDLAQPATGRWEDLQGERYLWRNLAYHLAGANYGETLQELLTDFSFLQAKLAATDIYALIADYTSAQGFQSLHLIRDALRLSAHVLTRDKQQLAPQLIGRLANQGGQTIQGLIEQAGAWRESTWLRPKFASLTQPGGVLVQTLEGHSAGVNGVAIVDNCRAVSASDDGTLRVWNLETGQTLGILEGHSDRVSAVAVLDDGRALSGSDDETLRLWDLETGQTLRTLKTNHGTSGVVLGGGRALAVSDAGTLLLWNPETGHTLRTFKEHLGRVTAVAVLDGGCVLSASDAGTLLLWNLETGHTLRTFEGDSDKITSQAVLGDDYVFLAFHHALRAFQFKFQVAKIALLRSERAFSFSPAARGESGLGAFSTFVRALELESARDQYYYCHHRLLGLQDDLEARPPVNTPEVHWNKLTELDSGRALSASSNGTLRLWDLETGHTLSILEGHSDRVTAVKILDGGRLVSASDDGTLRIWDLETEQNFKALEGHSHRVTAVAIVDSLRAVSASDDGKLRVWDLETGQIRTLEGHSDRITAMALLDGGRALSASSDRTMRWWDLETGQILRTLEADERFWESVSVVAVLEDGRALSASDEGTLRLWDLESGRTLKTLEGHSNRITAVAMLSDGRVVSASYDGTLRVWDLETGESLRTLEGHSDLVRAVAVLTGGRAVSASDDRTLRVWDPESGEALATLTLEAEATAVAVSPDGRTVVAGDQLGRVHFFDLVEPE